MSCDGHPARGRMGVAPLEKGLSPQRLGFKKKLDFEEIHNVSSTNSLVQNDINSSN